MDSRRFDHDAERAVLGSIMLDPDSYPVVLAHVRDARDFHLPKHSIMFDAVSRVAARGEHPDTTSVISELNALDRVNSCGGAQYLMELTDCATYATSIERHARTVAECAAERRLEDGLRRALELFADGSKRGKALTDAVTSLVAGAAESRRGSSLRPLQEVIRSVFERIEEAEKRGHVMPGIPSGLIELDALTAGFRPGQLILIAARPAMGKSALGLQIAMHGATLTKKPVAVFSLEMEAEELGSRMLGAEGNVDQDELRRYQLGRESMTRLAKAAQNVWEVPLFIDDGADNTVMDIRAKCRALASREGLAAVFIDYLQLIEGDSEREKENRERAVSEMSRGLKKLAKELGVPVIALSQLNRGPETRGGKDHRPKLADLRESGSLEQDADAVIFVYRDEVYDKNTQDRGIAELIVAKQRGGRTGTARVRWNGELTRFENLAAEPTYSYSDAEASDAAE